MPRSYQQMREDTRRAKMAAAVNKAMALDVPVILSDHDGNLLAEGRIVLKRASESYGLVVFCDDPDHAEEIPLPFIKRMTLKETT